MQTNAIPMYIDIIDDVEETTDVDFWLLTETTLDASEALYNVSPNALRALEAVWHRLDGGACVVSPQGAALAAHINAIRQIRALVGGKGR